MLFFWLSIVVVVLAIVLISRYHRRAEPVEMKLVDPEQPRRALKTRFLPADARERYSQTWAALQSRFRDDPEIALRDTDRLIQDAMRECGYPTGDFGRVSEQVTMQQTDVLDSYRVAHRITVKGETTMLETAEVEQAAAAFRAVFNALAEMDGIEA